MPAATTTANVISTRRWRTLRADTLDQSDICMLCGHPGSQQGGHRQPRATHPHLALDPTNVGPIHGHEGCPTCGRKCNQEQGAKSLDQMVDLNTSRDWFKP
jgi:hypothetical protein